MEEVTTCEEILFPKGERHHSRAARGGIIEGRSTIGQDVIADLATRKSPTRPEKRCQRASASEFWRI
jgi:hypothetical protein